ncbi:hydrophobin 1 [Lentinula aciculospora]|uniref:Hydrophobin n=1 Tax=Lentinula aciculospora TaxID=153920 RepID=A0A9W9AU97_9AGAR|nr:hydrophobin 1 [Lentinula aciculospora]
MFSSLLKMVSFAVLATAVVASPAYNGIEWNGGGSTTTVPQNECSTGNQQCCQSVQMSNAAGVATLLGLLGIAAPGTNVPVGLTCNSIAGSGCQAQAVCCTDNAHGGLISIGCLPLQL